MNQQNQEQINQRNFLIEFEEKCYDLEKLKPYNDFLVECSQKNYLDLPTHKHHILPRSMDGSDKKQNLICLSLLDHFQSHVVLANCFEMAQAGRRKNLNSCNFIMHHVKRYMIKNNYDVPKEFIDFWNLAHEIMKDFNKGENNIFFGKKHTDETRQKISEIQLKRYETGEKVIWNKGLTKETSAIILRNSIEYSGENHWNFGKTNSEYQKQRAREVHTGKIISEETKQKMSDAQSGENNYMFGKHHTEERKEQISLAVTEFYNSNDIWNKGKNKFNNESMRKISESLSGENHPNFGKSQSKETRRRISEATKGKPKKRKILVDGVVFESIAEAARQLNLSYCTVKDHLESQKDKWKNWIYLNDDSRSSGNENGLSA